MIVVVPIQKSERGVGFINIVEGGSIFAACRRREPIVHTSDQSDNALLRDLFNMGQNWQRCCGHFGLLGRFVPRSARIVALAQFAITTIILDELSHRSESGGSAVGTSTVSNVSR